MQTTIQLRTMAGLIPQSRLRAPSLVIGGALLTAAAAQVSIPLGFTPVPITAQTFAVLLVSAALGWRMAVSSQALYWVMGACGLPFYASAKGGWSVATGSTFGYFIGFVVAAALVGYLAERGQDRALATSFAVMSAATVVIYACGVTWLAHFLDVPFYSGDGKDAFTYGLAPFIVGDLVKIILAAVLTPSAWWFVSARRSR